MEKLTFKVVDEDGKAVMGAEINAWAFTVKEHTNIHCGWVKKTGRRGPFYSDPIGEVEFEYPRTVQEDWEIDKIDIRIDHPEYCPQQWRLDVDSPNKPIEMKKGATLMVSGYLGSKGNTVEKVYPQISCRGGMEPDTWKKLADGKRMHCGLRDGVHQFRLVYLPEDDVVHFSDEISIDAIKGEIYDYHLELKPGIRLEARLDDSVPRAITNGSMHVRVPSGPDDCSGEFLDWSTWREIDSEGMAVFESLPAGTAQIVALCDGAYCARQDQFYLLPEFVPLEHPVSQVTLATQPTGTFEAEVKDTEGLPLKGVRCYFGPNVHWKTGKCGLSEYFAHKAGKSEECIQLGRKILDDRENREYQYHQRSGKDGKIRVENLPTGSLKYHVSLEGYEVANPAPGEDPFRQLSVKVEPRGTTKTTITMKRTE